MAAGDLTTLNDVKSWLTIEDNKKDAVLRRLITAASGAIRAKIERNLEQTNYDERYDGNGKTRLMLRNWPVTAITLLKVGATTITASPDGYSAGYVFDSTSIRLIGSSFSGGIGAVQVQYTAGYEAIPFDVAQACVELVALAYKAPERVGIVSMGLADQSVSYDQKTWDTWIERKLPTYMRVIPI